VGGKTIKFRHEARPILRGAKITSFLLSVLFATILTSSVFTRPTQAEFLNTVGTTVGCLLNVGTCPPPIVVPGEPTDPTGEPAGDLDPEEPSDPEENPVEDVTPPTGGLDLDPTVAGGATQTVTITGLVSDDNLTSYVLKLNGNIIQEVIDITETTVNISVPWSVATPNKVPSGIYTVTIDAKDKAGNPFHAEQTVEVDNDGPVVDVRGGGIIIKSGSIIPEVSAEDPRGISSYTWRASEGNPAALKYDENVKDPTFTPFIEGSYTFYVDVADGLGNVSSKEFGFSYARQLETVPLPIADDPTTKLINQNPSTPAVTPASTTATTRSGRDNITASDDAGVLGNSIAAAGLAPAATPSAIAPTDRGWSIFGFLWYWWLVVLAGLFTGYILIKKFVLSRVSNDS